MASLQARELVKNVLWSIPCAIFLGDYIGIPRKIHGDSMLPTLIPKVTYVYPFGSYDSGLSGDIVWVNHFGVKISGQLSEGDVVVFRSPADPHKKVVSRMVKNSEGWVQPRGAPIPIYLEKGQCWIEGDNPADTDGSRTYGPVPLALIEGKASCIIWPPTRWGFIQSHMQEPNSKNPFN